MQLPMIALSILPDLSKHLTAVFGATQGVIKPGHNDTVVMLATFLYETTPPSNFL